MNRALKTCAPALIFRIQGALIIALLGMACLNCAGTSVSSEPPAAPAGYVNTKAVTTAIALGVLKLVDLNPEVPETLESFTGIVYREVDGIPLALDVYRRADLTEPAPVLFFVHGGSWKSGDRSDYLRYLVDYAAKGYVTVTVSYRFLQQAAFPAALDDVKHALSWVYEHAGDYMIDPGRIGLVGGSAGAHLALLAAYSDDVMEACTITAPKYRIGCVVDFYGPTDLRTDFAVGHPTVEAFLSTTFADNPGSYLTASPVAHVTPDDPPTLIFHGTIDETVPVQQADLLNSALQANGVTVEYHRLEGWPHTMDAAGSVNRYCQFYMDAFFERFLQ